jgi:hypothetical protein
MKYGAATVQDITVATRSLVNVAGVGANHPEPRHRQGLVQLDGQFRREIFLDITGLRMTPGIVVYNHISARMILPRLCPMMAARLSSGGQNLGIHRCCHFGRKIPFVS